MNLDADYCADSSAAGTGLRSSRRAFCAEASNTPETTVMNIKPAGWVVDMRHYVDDETGDLPAVLPERVCFCTEKRLALLEPVGRGCDCRDAGKSA